MKTKRSSTLLSNLTTTRRSGRIWLRVPAALAVAAAALSLAAVGSASAETTSASGGTMINALPFTVSSPGTYYLTSNFSFTGNGTAITVNSSGVTIDLNGHTITNTSSNANTSTGVAATDRANVAIRNGTLATFSTGINLGATTVTNASANIVENVTISNALSTAVNLNGTGCRLYHCRFALTGGAASNSTYYGVFLAGNGNIIEDCDFAGKTPYPGGGSGGTGILYGIWNNGGYNFALNNRLSNFTNSDYDIVSPYGTLKVRGTLSDGGNNYNFTDAGSNN